MQEKTKKACNGGLKQSPETSGVNRAQPQNGPGPTKALDPIAMRKKQLKNRVAAKLYDPTNPSGYSSIGLSFIDLPTGSRVFDTAKMNAAKDETGQR